jgi:polyisoprenoid-binding protein YceI
MTTRIPCILFAVLLATPASAAILSVKKVAFVAETNVKMFKFKGEAQDLKGSVESAGTTLSSLQLRIPVDTLKTGMGIRDLHMKERVFTAKDGTIPDVVYVAERSDCKTVGSEQECAIQGKLTIRGEQKSYPLTVTVKGAKNVQGHAQINVLDFGVDPKQLLYSGIKVDPSVAVDFEATLP